MRAKEEDSSLLTLSIDFLLLGHFPYPAPPAALRKFREKFVREHSHSPFAIAHSRVESRKEVSRISGGGVGSGRHRNRRLALRQGFPARFPPIRHLRRWDLAALAR
ncbi:MAG: hypothetical protein EOP84_36665 [Verrucomicrobiaceae bacterium]|nr:MAG: hypothetical protein EOP84_36665 [Verrucomicrobiaceae bacterium]